MLCVPGLGLGCDWRWLVPFGIVGQLIIFLDTSSFLFVVLESFFISEKHLH